MIKRPRFTKRAAANFQDAVKERVEAWFAATGTNPYADKAMKLKTLLHILAYFLVASLILSDHFQGLPLIALWSLFGIVQGLIGFNIAHDALHGSYFPSSRHNRWLGYIYDWDGESSFVWKETHNGLHHTYTNISGHDGDIGKGALLRFSPNDPWHPHHRFQVFYAPFLYALVSLSWVFWGDYTGAWQSYKEGRAGRKELVPFFFFKLCNLCFVLILPLMVLSAPAWQILLGFLMMHLVCGVFVSLVFQLAHVVEGVEFPIPGEEGQMRDEWAVHEMKTTSNFATQSRCLSWFLGGLNFQVEHHLFPQVCHVHYPQISSIVKKTAQDYALPYNEHKTLRQAIVSHFKLLKKLGEPC